MPKTLHIYDEMFRENIYFLGCKTFKELKKIAQKEIELDISEKDVLDSDGKMFEYYRDGIRCYLIWVKNFKKEPINKSMSILSHECLHVVMMIMERKGIKLKEKYNSEMYAYYLQFLMNKILSVYK